LRELTIGKWTGERSEPTIVDAELQLVTPLNHRQIVDEIDVTLLVGGCFTHTVLAYAADEEQEAANFGGEPRRKQEGIRKRRSSAEIIQIECSAKPVIAVIGAQFVADTGLDQLREPHSKCVYR
jgi:hypothetical protein